MSTFSPGRWRSFVFILIILITASCKDSGSKEVDSSDGSITGSTKQSLAKIVFDSNKDGFLDLYSINSDGTGLFRITNTPDEEYGASWSPDGKQIAYANLSANHQSGTYSVQVINADGSGNLTVMNEGDSSYGGEDIELSWSSDGKYLLLKEGEIGAEYVINLAEGTSTKVPGSSATWTATGHEYLYVELMDFDRGSFSASKLMIGTPDNLAGTLILEQDDLLIASPSLSPSGTLIAFYLAKNEGIPGYPSYRQSSVYVINKDGSNLRQIPNSEINTLPGYSIYWVPNTDRLVFNGNDYSVNLDGGDSQAVDRRIIRHLSPDGNYAYTFDYSQVNILDKEGNVLETVDLPDWYDYAARDVFWNK